MAERRPRVLLVDDYQGLLDAWRRLLSPTCDVVGSLSRGRDVLDAATKLEPDVVVLDLTMPDVSGLEVCRQLRAERPGTKIVIVSAADGPDLRQAALRFGASAFVSKYSAALELEPAIHGAVGSVGESG